MHCMVRPSLARWRFLTSESTENLDGNETVILETMRGPWVQHGRIQREAASRRPTRRHVNSVVIDTWWTVDLHQASCEPGRPNTSPAEHTIICKWNLDSPICRLKSPPGSFSSILQSENLAWTETPLCSSGGSTIVGGCLRDLVTSGFVIACCCVYCLQCTAQYDLVCVGHCLGAGVAAILAVLLRREYPDLHCFAYSPPGCLMRYQSISQSVP